MALPNVCEFPISQNDRVCRRWVNELSFPTYELFLRVKRIDPDARMEISINRGITDTITDTVKIIDDCEPIFLLVSKDQPNERRLRLSPESLALYG